MSRPTEPAILYDFSASNPDYAWRIQDDVVMGGRSSGHYELNEDGHGRFFGEVSLENNGGFSSVMHALDQPYSVKGRTAFSLRIKGDGKSYAFRVQSAAGQGFNHRAEFPTTGEWETIVIPFASMKPVYRGRALNLPNYAGQDINRLQLLIGNKKAEAFEIVLDVIEVI